MQKAVDEHIAFYLQNYLQEIHKKNILLLIV